MTFIYNGKQEEAELGRVIKNVSCEEARREKNAIAVDSLIFTVTTKKKVT